MAQVFFFHTVKVNILQCCLVPNVLKKNLFFCVFRTMVDKGMELHVDEQTMTKIFTFN